MSRHAKKLGKSDRDAEARIRADRQREEARRRKKAKQGDRQPLGRSRGFATVAAGTSPRAARRAVTLPPAGRWQWFNG